MKPVLKSVQFRSPVDIFALGKRTGLTNTMVGMEVAERGVRLTSFDERTTGHMLIPFGAIAAMRFD